MNSNHGDFPTLLAEALDALAGADMEARQAAAWLGCTPSQLVRFLRREPQAIELVNRRRQLLGKSPYL